MTCRCCGTPLLVRSCDGVQAYEGLQTAHKLKQEYVFLPAKLKEVYLAYLLEHLEDHKVHHTLIIVTI